MTKSWKGVFSLRFLLSGTKAAAEQTVSVLPEVVPQRAVAAAAAAARKAIVPFFSTLPAHTSQSPGNLLIMPPHLDKTKRKLPPHHHPLPAPPPGALKGEAAAALSSGVRVNQSHGHLDQASNRCSQTGDNANSNSIAATIIVR